MKFLNIFLLLGIRLFGRWRQVVWGFWGLGFLTKLCLGIGYGTLGRKLPIYGVRLLPPNKGRVVEVGALELSEGHMVVGCRGRELAKMQIVSLVMWCMQWERVAAFDFGMTLGAVLLLWKSYIWNYLSVLWLKKLWFLIWFFMHQIGVVGVKTYFSVVHLMTRKQGDFTLSFSMFLPEYPGGRVMMF